MTARTRPSTSHRQATETSRSLLYSRRPLEFIYSPTHRRCPEMHDAPTMERRTPLSALGAILARREPVRFPRGNSVASPVVKADREHARDWLQGHMSPCYYSPYRDVLPFASCCKSHISTRQIRPAKHSTTPVPKQPRWLSATPCLS